MDLVEDSSMTSLLIAIGFAYISYRIGKWVGREQAITAFVQADQLEAEMSYMDAVPEQIQVQRRSAPWQ